MESKLTITEKAILERLVNPTEQEQVKYPFDEDFQRILVGMMVSDRFFLCQSLGLVKPVYFVNEVHQLAIRLLLEYFETYRTMPSKVFMRQVVSDALRERYQSQDNETFQAVKLLYLGELNTVYDYYSRGGVGNIMPGLDSAEAILDKITAFAKTQAMKFAFHKSLELIRKNPEADSTWAKVDEIIREARLVERRIDLGLDYFGTPDDRYVRMAKAAEDLDVFTTGFATIDNSLHGGGLVRGELGAWMGLPGSGKSLALVTASVKNIIRGKKVLYISTEMDSDRIAARFDSQFSLIGQHELMLRKEEVIRALTQEVSNYDDKKRLVIKQFPSGTADANTVFAFHSQCVMHGFRPDLMVVDYPGDMKHSETIALHLSMQRMLVSLRGFGGEENHCTLVAVQPNRGATELGLEEFLDESKQGGSFAQNQVLDAFWTLNQTDHERKASVGRVFVSKARNGKSRFSFKIRYGFPTQTLTMDEISVETYRREMNRVQEITAEATEQKIDKIVTGGPSAEKWQPSDGEQV